MFADDGYRVELELFSGPMDLLLHLVREDELDAVELPVAVICDRFLAYLGDLERIDIDDAGDFLVMAATLMRMKARALLPAEEQVLDEEDDLDPRFELVRQLIQYRRFRHVADLLEARRAEAARRFARGMHPELAERPTEAGEVSLDGVGVELLFAAFARLLRETQSARPYVVTVDDTPIEVHIARVEALVPPGVVAPFRALVPLGASRAVIIGVLLALLELLKRQRIDVRQEHEFGAIEVLGREPPEDAPDASPADGAAPAGAEGAGGAA